MNKETLNMSSRDAGTLLSDNNAGQSSKRRHAIRLACNSFLHPPSRLSWKSTWHSVRLIKDTTSVGWAAQYTVQSFAIRSKVKADNEERLMTASRTRRSLCWR